MLKIKFLVIAVLISFSGMFSSCYYDYGIDSANSNVVVTAYDNTYPFSSVTKYILDTTVNKIGSGSLTSNYDALIISTVRTNLNNLGWTPAAASDSLAAGVVKVATGITTSTYTVNYNDYYWYGGGYYWGYPSYGYDYSYSYTTGSIIIGIGDLNKRDGSKLPVQWTGVLNGVTGQSNPNSLITSGINQAFSTSQSPYLH
jgi:hypothetical protein